MTDPAMPAPDPQPAPTSAAPNPAFVPPANAARLETHALRPGLGPRRNPADFAISLAAYYGAPPAGRRQSLRGFEDHYTDIVDFIVRATHRVWEEKNVGYIYDIYSHNARVTSEAGLEWGRDHVVANTLQVINAFPDARLVADEVIWAGDDEVGFSTSHRIVFQGTHTGHSPFGPPTGRKVQYWMIANCLFLANECRAEWEIPNTASLLQQLGFDLRAKARELGTQRLQAGGLNDPRYGEPRLLGQGKPAPLPPPAPGASFDPEDFLRRMYQAVWNGRLVGQIEAAYAPNLRFAGPADRVLFGLEAYQNFVMSLLSACPDLALTIDDVYWMGNDLEGYTASTRWGLVGTHTGAGLFGAPTGRRVSMWGITQHVIKHGRITDEWLLFNEFEVLQQLLHD